MHILSRMCMTKDIGVNGNLFGGNMMAWMDEAAAIYAIKQTLEPNMVTMQFEEMVFKKPVKVGDLIEFHGDELSHTKCSIKIGLETSVDGIPVLATNAIFVCVDKDGLKKPIDKYLTEQKNERFR